MGLFDKLKPRWKNSDPDVRITAAKELEDVSILIKMSEKDPEWFVRHRTFDVIREKFSSQDSFAYLARNSIDEEIRRKAVKKLSDREILQDIAHNDKYRYVRDAALHRLDELKTDLWSEAPPPTASSEDK
tara:strand:+ start:3183 stop:3572 length:390 start_codon:yes stop_codon:yes gene_type:complete